MTKFIVRDDVIDPEMFFEIIVFYEPFVRILHDAGDYAFVMQIEELWKVQGGKGLVKRMVDANVLKSGIYNRRTFVYNSEATLKFIKYADSKEVFDDNSRKKMMVATLTNMPSPKQLLSSALKFKELAKNMDGEIEKWQKCIGKISYREHIGEIADIFARRILPDFATHIPIESDIFETSSKKGTYKVGVRVSNSHYERYKVLVPKIVNTLQGLYDTAKCALIFKPEELKNGLNLNFEVVILDVGSEKTVRNYVIMCFEIFELLILGGFKERNVKFIVSTYSTGHKGNLFDNFVKYFANPDNLKRLHKTKWYLKGYTFDYDLKDFHVDPILEKVMEGNVMRTRKERSV